MTATRYRLPFRDDLGFCNVLLSALGGDGANMAAKLLFKIAVQEMGLDGGYDARYGSEKKGTATDVSLRLCELDSPVRQSGPSTRPHVLVIFHDNMIQPLELHRGLHDGATCVVNTRRPPEEIRGWLRLNRGRIVCLDASAVAHDSGSRLNMPLLAVLTHELGFPDELVTEQIRKRWPRAANANITAFEQALHGVVASQFEQGAYETLVGPPPRGPIGWSNMLNGGTIDALTHTTRGRDNRLAAQGRVPRFAPESCISCGICLTVCSDPGGLVWSDGKMVGIDDRFCKGCMRCVEVCPETKKGKALVAASGEG